MNTLALNPWKDYELLDVGNFKKLERFGNYVLIRPEPQALWDSKWNIGKWKQSAHVEFIQKGSNNGTWNKLKPIPDRWTFSCPLDKQINLNLRLSLTGFKHIGVFPEQSVNWLDIYRFLNPLSNTKMLNLFAYTGAASIVGALAKSQVTHVDSIKQIVTWANDNAQLNDINTIKWIVDDALSFVKRQVNKNAQYECIVLDPPAYGHGPKGEKWKLEELLNEMMMMVLKLLNPKKHLLIVNAYSLGLSALVLKNLLQDYAMQTSSQLEIGELYIPSQTGLSLPLGIYGKLRKN